MNEKNKSPECANASGRGFTAEEIVGALRLCEGDIGLGECADCPLEEIVFCAPELRNMAADLIEAQAKRTAELEEERRWIPVGERLPETVRVGYGEYSEAVEVVTAGRKVMIAVWDGVDWNCAADYWEAWGDPITHWRNTVPLPKRPEA